MRPRSLALLLVALALLGFGGDVMERSARQLSPRYDEVAYLALARDYAREGGVTGTIKCHLEARCREDNRPPLFQFMLQAVADDAPAFFARAKLVSLATALFLFALVFIAVRPWFSSTVALGSVVAASLMPALADFASHVQHDALYAALTFAAVFLMALWQERGFAWWVLLGAIVGLAFLTKGSGHLLLLPLAAVSLYHHRRRLLGRPILYAALCGFVAVSFFLLWRNIRLAGSPFYNVNGRGLWLDRWQDVWALQLDPEWSQVGLGWYLRRHSWLDLAWKIARGAGLTVGVFVYAAGVGFANPVARTIAGVAVCVLGSLGLRRRWRAGHQTEVFAVLVTLALFGTALSLATSGGPGPQARYTFPYALLLIPYFVAEVIERASALARRLPAFRPAHVGLAALAVLLAVRLTLVSPALLANPLAFYRVEPRWHETSLWLAHSLAPGERFALPYQSLYSTWDAPTTDTDPRWNFWYGMGAKDLTRYLDGSHIRRLMIDTAAPGLAEYADKLSPASDAHGPLAFLDWPRCFADSAEPSRFLIYCRR
jgi:4-amino-4-deoxy-L-arabinose transferase-like glycosyltransferase